MTSIKFSILELIALIHSFLIQIELLCLLYYIFEYIFGYSKIVTKSIKISFSLDENSIQLIILSILSSYYIFCKTKLKNSKFRRTIELLNKLETFE